MSAEAARVAGRAKDAETFCDRVTVKNRKEMTKCAHDVAKKCPAKVILLVAPIEENNAAGELIVAAIIPANAPSLLGTWLRACTLSALSGSATTQFLAEQSDAGPTIEYCEITYVPNSEKFPLKIADEVIANSFAFLKKSGVYKEVEEEKEYDFDDIE